MDARRRFRRAALAAVTLVAFVLLTANAAVAGEHASDADYATAVCSTLLELRDREGELVANHAALEADDPSAFQRDAIAIARRYVRQLKDARAALSETQPSAGDDVSRPFDTYLGKAIKRLRAIVAEFEDADAGAPAFQADVSTFEANLQFLNRELPDPFARVRDQSLLVAIRDEQACGELVAVAGG